MWFSTFTFWIHSQFSAQRAALFLPIRWPLLNCKKARSQTFKTVCQPVQEFAEPWQEPNSVGSALCCSGPSSSWAGVWATLSFFWISVLVRLACRRWIHTYPKTDCRLRCCISACVVMHNEDIPCHGRTAGPDCGQLKKVVKVFTESQSAAKLTAVEVLRWIPIASVAKLAVT